MGHGQSQTTFSTQETEIKETCIVYTIYNETMETHIQDVDSPYQTWPKQPYESKQPATNLETNRDFQVECVFEDRWQPRQEGNHGWLWMVSIEGGLNVQA